MKVYTAEKFAEKLNGTAAPFGYANWRGRNTSIRAVRLSGSGFSPGIAR